jgi:pimeloyl-ACP methyl ester carboxylesterase
MSAELHRLSVGGTELRYVDAGSGETVVLVHGAVSDHRFWRAQLVALAPSYRCIALDQRYFGPAPWPDDGSNYSLSTHSEDLAGFIRQVARDLPVHLVGTSYGSTVALHVVLHRDELVRSLFLYEPSLSGVVEDPRLLAEIAMERKGLSPAIEAQSVGDIDGAVRGFVEWITRDPRGLDAFPAEFRSMVDDNARTFDLHLKAPPVMISRADFRRLRVPLTLVHGAETRRVYAIVTETLHSLVPGSSAFVIPGAHHVGPVVKAAEFNALLLAHLLKLRGST